MNQVDHEYESKYYDYINRGSISSAQQICPIIIKWFSPSSLIDIGCGVGAWCSVWKQKGIDKVIGVDGDYIQIADLLVEEENFIHQDLSKPFKLDNLFAMAVSLEVAEHILEEKADIFLDNLTQNSDIVMFSAAPPGQGGEFHVNEQPLEYWRKKFEKRGYRCFDPLRSMICDNKAVEPWYRYNTLFYIKNSALDNVPHEIINSEIKIGESIPDIAPLSWRIRSRIIFYLPNIVKNMLIKMKHIWNRNIKNR